MDERELCIRLSSGIVERLETLADGIGKPLGYLIQTALEKYIQDCDENTADT